MKILVTGATGFIGNYVIDQLLKNGVDVIATSTSVAKAQKSGWYSKVDFIPLNFNDINSDVDYYSHFKQPDKMIHLAWEGLPNYKEDFHLNENLPRHYKLLSNMIMNGLKNITVTGTCLEYGMKEGCLSEDDECRPDNSYSIAKSELYKLLKGITEKQNAKLKWVRLFYLYGNGQSPKSLISQLENALQLNEKTFNMSGGQQMRDFLAVEDAAKNIIAITLQDKITGIINCCSGRPIKVQQFIEDYLKLRDKIIHLNLGYYPYPDYEPFAFWGDNKKLRNINQL